MKVPATSTLTWWCAMGRLGVTLTRAGVLVVPHHVMRRRGRPTGTIQTTPVAKEKSHL